MKYSSQKFPADAEIQIALDKKVEDYHFNHASVKWKSNYDFYQEIYFFERNEGDRVPLPFLFKENSSKPIADSLEETYNMYLEILELNSEIVFSINAYFNFYENNEIQMQRAKQIKKGFIKRGVDPDRLVINVKEEIEYRKSYQFSESKDKIITLNEKYAKNASKEELEQMKMRYQIVFISILSWDYNE